jgi:hypothetical protein
LLKSPGVLIHIGTAGLFVCKKRARRSPNSCSLGTCPCLRAIDLNNVSREEGTNELRGFNMHYNYDPAGYGSDHVMMYHYHVEKKAYYEVKCREYAHHKKYYKKYYKKYCYHKEMVTFFSKSVQAPFAGMPYGGGHWHGGYPEYPMMHHHHHKHHCCPSFC